MLAPSPSGPPFRADHVGSLLRPTRLKEAFRDHSAGRIEAAEFLRIQNDCVREVVRMQEAVGLNVVTDGEFRRASYWGRFVERTDGFVIRPASFKFRDDSGHEVEFTAPYAAGKVRRRQPLARDEFDYLRQVTAVTPKITLPAPSTMHFYRCMDFAAPQAYGEAKSFFADLARLFREEIAALAEAGCRYVQLDEVAIAMLCDPRIRETVAAAGADPDHLVDLYIAAINDSVAEAPADMIIGVHLCRGNFRGRYLAEGGYDSVAERLFVETRARHFLLEYDTARAGDFAPLRFLPKEKGAVLGLVSSKTPALEPLDDLKRRVEDASRFADHDQLALGPQCGFASTVAGNPLTETQQKAKLELVVLAADAIWRR